MKKIVFLFVLALFGLIACGQNNFKYPLVIGTNGGTGGQVTLNGATSGSSIIRVPAVAGSALIFELPSTYGTNGQVLSTNGSGILSWQDGGAGSMTYPVGSGIPIVVSGASWGTTITDNSSNWNIAYGWGNHASAGYAPAASPTFTGTVVLPSTTSIGNASSTEIGYVDGLNGTAASRQDINDTINAMRTGAVVGLERVDSTGNEAGNYVTRKALVDSIYIRGSTLLEDLNVAGAGIKGIPIAATAALITYTNMTDGTAYWVMFNLREACTITGVKFIQRVAGVYTGDNYNGAALYSVSGTTYTQVASTTNDANFWTGSAYTLRTKPFSSTYNAAAGLYMVAYVYNQSAESAAPSVYDWNYVSAVSQLLTGSHKLAGTVSAQSTLPSTETTGDISASGSCYGMWLY